MNVDYVTNLGPGDYIYWDDPEDDVCSRVYKVKRVRVDAHTGSVWIEDEDGSSNHCYLFELRIATLRDVLPPGLVSAINLRLHDVPDDDDKNMLEWDVNSSVGYDCMKLAKKTEEFLTNITDSAVIYTDPVWDVVAHQCCIYAYA